jgi:uncharacterized protein (DUF305 family)
MRKAEMMGCGILAVCSLLFSACSDPKLDESAKSSSEQPVITGTPAGFNDEDVDFAEGTIKRHRLSMEAAKFASDRSDDPELVALAADISAVQKPEFELAKAFLAQWSFDSEESRVDPGAAYGPIEDPTIDRLATLRGPEFDTLWLETMVKYHRETISGADAEIARGTNADAVTLAKQMQGNQQSQLGRLEQMLAGR